MSNVERNLLKTALLAYFVVASPLAIAADIKNNANNVAQVSTSKDGEECCGTTKPRSTGVAEARKEELAGSESTGSGSSGSSGSGSSASEGNRNLGTETVGSKTNEDRTTQVNSTNSTNYKLNRCEGVGRFIATIFRLRRNCGTQL